MYEELYDLLCELGLGTAAEPVCDLVTGLIGESLSLAQLMQEISSVLHAHDTDVCAEDILAHLIAQGFADVQNKSDDAAHNEGGDAAAPLGSATRDSELLCDASHTIVVDPKAARSVHETARGWLDIDSGIYFDVRQHAAGTDSER